MTSASLPQSFAPFPSVLEDGDALKEDDDNNGQRGRSMSVIGKLLAVMDMESHDVKMESI